MAAKHGSNRREFVIRAIEKQIARLRDEKRRFSVRLPLVPSKRPGALRSMTNAEIEELLD